MRRVRRRADCCCLFFCFSSLTNARILSPGRKHLHHHLAGAAPYARPDAALLRAQHQQQFQQQFQQQPMPQQHLQQQQHRAPLAAAAGLHAFPPPPLAQSVLSAAASSAAQKAAQLQPVFAASPLPDEPDQERYCICNQPSFGEMVGCDNDNVRAE
jgi:hypothetical protein